MSNRDRVALRYMPDHAREAVEMILGKPWADLDTHRMLNLALVRLVEVIGEAAARVSADVKRNQQGIPLERLVFEEDG